MCLCVYVCVLYAPVCARMFVSMHVCVLGVCAQACVCICVRHRVCVQTCKCVNRVSLCYIHVHLSMCVPV